MNQPSNLATSLFKALDLLTLLASRSRGAPISELVEQMDLPRSSVIRMLDSLIHYGLIERDSDRYYRVTEKFNEWRLDDFDERLKQQYRPLMRKLTDQVGEMTVLGRLKGRKIAHLHHEEPDKRVRVVPPAGRRFEMRNLAMGKLVMSVREDLIPEDLGPERIAELDVVRHEGCAWNHSESEPDIVAWATWLGEPSGLTPMLAITWPAFRFSESSLKQAKEILNEELKNVLFDPESEGTGFLTLILSSSFVMKTAISFAT